MQTKAVIYSNFGYCFIWTLETGNIDYFNTDGQLIH
jgi:hypothetical protein